MLHAAWIPCASGVLQDGEKGTDPCRQRAVGGMLAEVRGFWTSRTQNAEDGITQGLSEDMKRWIGWNRMKVEEGECMEWQATQGVVHDCPAADNSPLYQL